MAEIKESGQGQNEKLMNFAHFFTPWTFPRAKLRRQNFYDLGGSLGEELGEELGEIFCAFSWLHLLCRMTHKSSPKIPPNLSLHVL